MTAGDQRFVLSLQCGSDDHFGRLVLHLLMLGWCTFVPLVGMLLVDWVWPVRQPVSEPGGCEDRPRRSTNKRHALGVLLKGIEGLFVDSGSGRELHFGFFFIAGDGEDSFCGNVGRQRRRILDAPVVDLYVISLFFRSTRFKGLDVKFMY